MERGLIVQKQGTSGGDTVLDIVSRHKDATAARKALRTAPGGKGYCIITMVEEDITVQSAMVPKVTITDGTKGVTRSTRAADIGKAARPKSTTGKAL